MLIKDFVKKYDPQNQFDVLVNYYKQIEFAWNNKIDLSDLKIKKFNKLFVSGLGGSAISADLMQNYLGNEINIPFLVNRNYTLPSFVDENTLIVISSYSGNTEETISVFKKALELKLNIVCISTGGKIGKLAEENKIPVVKILNGYQPRFALGLSFFSLLLVLQELDIINNQEKFVNEIVKIWKEKGSEFSKENNEAFKLAEQTVGKIPIIYSAADFTSAVGYRLKCQFNENSKLHAFHNILPEMNHNEIVGWETYSNDLLNGIIFIIIDNNYHPQVMKRFKISSGLAAKKNIEIIRLESNHHEFKVRLMDLIYLSDWITYYTAILRGFDPSEIDFINSLKESLT